MDAASRILEIVSAIRPIPACGAHVTQLLHEEDGEPYEVWRVDVGDQRWILKKAKEYEYEIYTSFFSTPCPHVPELLGTATLDGCHYLLEVFVDGHNLMHCTRPDLKATLDSLIALQDANWGNSERALWGYHFDKSLEGRIRRGQYLGHPTLDAAYQRFLEAYRAVPRTLCHDDLLPFNVLVAPEGARLIDWEFGGILPYPTSLARLLAHGSEDDTQLFVMQESDRQFAIDYYYTHLISQHGISYPAYRNTLDLFFFYEYREWVYVGNRYGNTHSTNYQRYLPLALRQAEHILNIQ